MRPAAGLHRPPRLRTGDRVAVVCPSGPADPARLLADCAVLRSLGLDVVLGEHALGPARSGYLAATDQDRAHDLEDAWLDPEIAAVVCARGGYGSARVLEHLRWDLMAGVAPKILLGSSDATSLHRAFATRLRVVTLFGPMPATAGFGPAGEPPDERTLAHLRTTLFSPEDALAFTSAHPSAPTPGRARGITTGGTLSLLAAAAGCAEAAPAAGAIVLLEDTGEEPYRIDRMLTQLLRAGWFAGAASVATGSWTECGPPGEVAAVLHDRLAPLGVPVLTGLDFGHGQPQLTVPLGVEAELDTEAGTLTLTSAALR
ncbi:LD-carboxypeptidase [Kitasatospora sp. NBC_00374]|uniref:S66 peptidase family protein n=1 Tax=Kitasatospora sp. NBC_00374 TaxID=2975964 RepID=UPI00324F449F